MVDAKDAPTIWLDVTSAPRGDGAPYLSEQAVLGAIAVLVRDRDAALARAEALRKANAINLCRAEQAESDAMKAESRLAEAVELLTRCLDEIDCDVYDDPCTQQIVFDAQAFLSGSTPSPAAPCRHQNAIGTGPCMLCPAPAAPTYADACQLCDRPPIGWSCTRERDHEGPCAAWPVAAPAQAAEPAADTAADRAIADCRAAIDSLAHPDTIALRECRLQLGASDVLRCQAESELATARERTAELEHTVEVTCAGLESCADERRALQTRITDLERMWDDCNEGRNALSETISKAVAELGSFRRVSGDTNVERALAILKGTRT